jgi:excisionase family DNA binding protein
VIDSVRTTTRGGGPGEPAPSMDNPVMTARELADYLRVHPSTIYRLLKQKRIPAFKVGSDWRFDRKRIDRWRLEQQTREK